MIMKSSLDKKNIRKINNLLKSINKNIYDCNKEVVDFNEELENNILTEINELIKNGLSEDIAVEKVINNFGSEKDLYKDIDQTFNKIYLKGILKGSFIVSLIGAIILFLTFIWVFSRSIFSKIIFEKYYFFTRHTYKVALIILAISIVLFFIWSITNSIFVKRSRNFILKIIPINLIGIINIYILISQISINLIVVFYIYISLLVIPILNYVILKKNKVFMKR